MINIYREETELHAAPFGTVVIDADGHVYRKFSPPGTPGRWWQAGPQGMFETVALPAERLTIWGDE